MYQRFFTGDLQSKYYDTDFDENQMLSARLRLIACASILNPVSFFLQEEGLTQVNPEFQSPEDPLALSSWEYRLPGVLPFGCILHQELSFFSEYQFTEEQKEEILVFLKEILAL